MIRNQVFLKPKAFNARKKVIAKLKNDDLHTKKCELSLGLAQPEELELLVIFETDAQLNRCKELHVEDSLTDLFRNYLPRSFLLNDELNGPSVSLHSHQHIMNNGGYYYYFK